MVYNRYNNSWEPNIQRIKRLTQQQRELRNKKQKSSAMSEAALARYKAGVEKLERQAANAKNERERTKLLRRAGEESVKLKKIFIEAMKSYQEQLNMEVRSHMNALDNVQEAYNFLSRTPKPNNAVRRDMRRLVGRISNLHQKIATTKSDMKAARNALNALKK